MLQRLRIGEISFVLVKTLASIAFAEPPSLKQYREETTYSTFIGETDSSNDDIVKELGSNTFYDSSGLTHECNFSSFEPVKNKQFKIKIEITRFIK